LVHAGERFEVLVDGRNGTAFDLIALPCGQNIMRLPPFDQPLALVTIRPEGADGNGKLPDRLATLPPLPQDLPPVSQELVMNMFRDKEGMMALEKTGLMAMGTNGQTDTAVIARVVDLIVNGPALSQSDSCRRTGSTAGRSRLARRALPRRETSSCAGALRKGATGCYIPCTSTAASSGSSRRTAVRPSLSAPAGRTSHLSQPVA
jgi:hypothetical protein